LGLYERVKDKTIQRILGHHNPRVRGFKKVGGFRQTLNKTVRGEEGKEKNR